MHRNLLGLHAAAVAPLAAANSLLHADAGPPSAAAAAQALCGLHAPRRAGVTRAPRSRSCRCAASPTEIRAVGRRPRRSTPSEPAPSAGPSRPVGPPRHHMPSRRGGRRRWWPPRSAGRTLARSRCPPSPAVLSPTLISTRLPSTIVRRCAAGRPQPPCAPRYCTARQPPARRLLHLRSRPLARPIPGPRCACLRARLVFARVLAAAASHSTASAHLLPAVPRSCAPGARRAGCRRPRVVRPPWPVIHLQG
jgi:hypothetical protein